MSENRDKGGMEQTERSLDPEDWEELRLLGHRAFDDMIDYLRTIADKPAWQPWPGHKKTAAQKIVWTPWIQSL